MDLEQEPTQSILIPGGKDEVSKSETWNIPTLPSLPSTGMALLCLAALSVQMRKVWRKKVPLLGHSWNSASPLEPGQGWKSDGSQCPQHSIGPESSPDATQETWRQLRHLQPKRDWGCSQR